MDLRQSTKSNYFCMPNVIMMLRRGRGGKLQQAWQLQQWKSMQSSISAWSSSRAGMMKKGFGKHRCYTPSSW